MSLRIVLRPEAEADLLGVTGWYEQERSELADALLSDQIEIMGVLHGSRDPRVWQERVARNKTS